MSLNDVTPARALLCLMRGEKMWLSLALGFSAIAVTLELVPYYLLYCAADTLLRPDGGTSLGTLAGLMASALTVRYLLMSVAGYCSHKAAFRLMYQIRQRMVRRLGSLPLAHLSSYSSGGLRKIVMNDSERLENVVAHHSVDLVAALLSPLVAAGFLFWLDWRMALAALLTVPLSLMLQMYLSKGMAERASEFHQATEQLNGAMVEFVRGMPVMKAFGQTATSFHLLHQRLNSYHSLVERFTRKAVPAWSMFVVLLNANLFILLPVGLALINLGSLTVPDFVLSLMLGSGLLKPLLRITLLGSVLREVFAGIARMQPLLDEGTLSAGDVMPTGQPFSLELRDVCFSYDQTVVVDKLNLRINAGEFYALIGPSGSGKSTLSALMAGLLIPSAGEVLLCGRPLPAWRDQDRAAAVAVVTQDIFLFRGTLADNLRLGNPDADEDDLRLALHVAQASDLLATLPEGLTTPLDERGLRLSGGERQRIGIARALLVGAPLLILDEATAFADACTEAAFYLALRQHYPNTTVVAIAHRLHAIRQADKLLLMEKGRWLAQGTHQQLLQECATYRQLWQSQFLDADWHIRLEGDEHVHA